MPAKTAGLYKAPAPRKRKPKRVKKAKPTFGSLFPAKAPKPIGRMY